MNWLDRQSFLGPDSAAVLADMTVGVVGLGGGGSPVVQQLAHLGVGKFVAVDHDRASKTNRNRLIGMRPLDALLRRRKASMAKRLVKQINPAARIRALPARWEDELDQLKACDVIVGAVDTFKTRAELEGFCRAHLIPYVDLGMDVHDLASGGFFMGGQVAVSMPGDLCMRCMGLITDDRLAAEAAKYGTAGAMPQVVWSNGVLASVAVNLIVKMFLPWDGSRPSSECIEFDANHSTLGSSQRVATLRGFDCRHHPLLEAGSPLFDLRSHRAGR